MQHEISAYYFISNIGFLFFSPCN